MLNKLKTLRLQVRNPDTLVNFYQKHLGMNLFSQGESYEIGYHSKGTLLSFSSTDHDYIHDNNDNYWKIGITLPNIDIAYEQLIKSGIQVSEPHQFLNIGYMCHFRDPEGFQIELLQHDFDGYRPSTAGDPLKPLGGGATLGQITLRCSDIDRELAYYQSLGMSLLSIQPVHRFGFTLYFLAFTAETPPLNQLDAVENRPWLWKRPYTVLELQHKKDTPIQANPNFSGIVFE